MTDGDIRRYILSGNGLDSSIANAFNQEPFILTEDNLNHKKNSKLLFKKYNIDTIPIIDPSGTLKDYISLNDIYDKDKINYQNKIKEKTSLVIMAGGLGSRLKPFTNILPKPLIPINGRPIINHILDNFADAGVQNVHLSIGYKANIIRAYLREEYSNNSKIKFFEEISPRGTAGSLKDIELKDENIFVINCDVLIDIDLFDLFMFHKTSNSDFTIVASAKNLILNYGSCEIDNDGNLLSIHEKPSYPHLVNTGLYIIKKKYLIIFKMMEYMIWIL